MQQLRDRVVEVPRSSGGRGLAHPFKLSVRRESSQNRLYVEHGFVEAHDFEADSAGNYLPVAYPLQVYMSNGTDPLENNPWQTGTGGYEVLSTSTTYGVWLKVGAASDLIGDLSTQSGTQDGMGALDDEHYTGAEFGIAGRGTGGSNTAVIHTNSTYTDEDEAYQLVSGTAGYSYFYLGKVAIDGSNAATITQWRRSDLSLPMFSMPVGVDTDNLVAEGVMFGLTAGGTLTVTDNTDGTWEVSD